ncbi:hypothetical protein [Streptomyces cellulosae]|uniref:hypothetical protein n=1 Tax=Streptomyces cellulosae TaxID=1968 RepID=UPI0018FF66E3|nr:hypothetical protein [Streptomyces cellulosae]
MVGNHVMKFPCDAHPFLDHAVTRFFLALTVGVVRTGRGVLAAYPDVAAECRGQQNPSRRVDDGQDQGVANEVRGRTAVVQLPRPGGV